jgi:UDP-glucose 4-epimerase
MLNVLVVGGAGFIGSHMVKMLVRQACRVPTLDDLSSGHRDASAWGESVHFFVDSGHFWRAAVFGDG